MMEELSDAEIEAVLESPRDFHRRASMRWDFVASENSTGFHAPQEANRMLGQAIDYARRGQLILQGNLQEHGIALAPTTGSGRLPEPSAVIAEHHPPVGSVPPAALMELDRLAAPGQ